ncbi:MAG TPA: P-loop NTPase fold protein [Terracidiphilus sp.]|jgi:hypothetical protein
MKIDPSTETPPRSKQASAYGDHPPAAPAAPAAQAPPVSAEPRLYVQTSSVGDSAAAVDELGFELYVNAIADFLVAPNTRAPLTCSIEGSWGSGKSSFMLQLRNRLAAADPNCRTIEFNAWKYDKQEELWAAFALKVTRHLRTTMKWFDRVISDVRLFKTRIKGWGQRLSLLALVIFWLLLLAGSIGVVVWTVRASHPQRLTLFKALVASKESTAADKNRTSSESKPPKPSPAPLDPFYEWLSWSPSLSAGVLILLLLGRIPESIRKRLFEAQLERYIDKPDYKGKAAFVDTFSEDFSRMIEAYSPPSNAKIFVFIDDLDRCEAPKAADLMQAINLMIGDGNPLIFILGLDRAKVASAIAFKFREIIPYIDPSFHSESPDHMRRFGDDFLEKFIQLSFRLPISSNEQQARKFIDSLITDPSKPAPAATTGPVANDSNSAGESYRRALRIESGAESERIRDVLMMVREVVQYSPRRIKNFLNSFRLALYIASSQGLLDVVDQHSGFAEVTPERLGKFLILILRYPELRSTLTREPDFLYQLESVALNDRTIGEREWSPDTSLTDEWLMKPGVLKLVTFGLAGKTSSSDGSRRYSMEDFPVGKFDSILPAIPPPGTNPPNAPQSESGAPPFNTTAETVFVGAQAPAQEFSDSEKSSYA